VRRLKPAGCRPLWLGENTVFGYYVFQVLGSTAIVICVYVVNFRRSLVVATLHCPQIARKFLGQIEPDGIG
jgi:hypothetical protein